MYLARVSGNEKLFRFDLANKKRTQITFGTHDDTAARFLDADTIVFSSTAVDPAQAIDPEVARNAQHLQPLDAGPEDRRAQAVHRLARRQPGAGHPQGLQERPGGVHHLLQGRLRPAHDRAVQAAQGGGDRRLRLARARSSTSRRRSPTRSCPRTSGRRSGSRRCTCEGRPSFTAGVTNSGDLFGGTEISLTDVLGDHRLDFTAGAVMQYTTFAGSYMNMSKRFQYAVQGIYQKSFYYGTNPYYYDPLLQPYVSRDNAESTQTVVGGSVFGIYPLDAFRRVELNGGSLLPVERLQRRLGDGLLRRPVPGLRHPRTSAARCCRSRRRSSRRRRCSASSGRCRATRCGSMYEVRAAASAR